MGIEQFTFSCDGFRSWESAFAGQKMIFAPQKSVIRSNADDRMDGRVQVRWYFPPDNDPIPNATLEFQNGVLTVVDSDSAIPTQHLTNTAVIPGLVNAHTHLELSDLSEPLPFTGSFPDWIREVVRHRRERKQSPNEALMQGLREIVETGTVAVGDIEQVGDEDHPVDQSLRVAPRRLGFREIICLNPDDGQKKIEAALAAECEEKIQLGLSPHAPYSVHLEVVQKIVDEAIRRSVPVAMHLAETRAELELLQTGSGELATFLKSLGIWRDDLFRPGTRPLDYLRILSRAPRALVIHGNYLDDEDVDFLAGNPQMSVVYCPRTHACFDHQTHPWLQMMNRGVNVALGTDSRASNPDLNVWNEVLFLRERFSDVCPKALLQLATINGQKALGFVRASNSTDWTFIELHETASEASAAKRPWEELFHRDSRPVGSTVSRR